MSGDRYIIRDQNAKHFLTFTVIDWVDVFTRKEFKLEIVDSMNYCVNNKGLIVYGWVIMSNHVHCIWQAKEGYSLSNIIRDFKKFTAKRIIKMIEHGSESRKEWLKITFLVLQLIIVVRKALLRLLECNKIAVDKSSSLQTRTRERVALSDAHTFSI